MVRYDAVVGGLSPEGAEPGARFEAVMAGALARGNGVIDGDDALRVLRDDRAVLTLTRQAPGLGRVFPFGL